MATQATTESEIQELFQELSFNSLLRLHGLRTQEYWRFKGFSGDCVILVNTPSLNRIQTLPANLVELGPIEKVGTGRPPVVRAMPGH